MPSGGLTPPAAPGDAWPGTPGSLHEGPAAAGPSVVLGAEEPHQVELEPGQLRRGEPILAAELESDVE
jgi:hypothetical protein